MKDRLPGPVAIALRLALGGLLLLMAAAYVCRVFDFRQQPDYGEGTVLAMVERMGSQRISSGWLRGPVYTATSYGPGYYWVVRAADSVLPWRHSLIPGRLVSLAASLALALATRERITLRLTCAWMSSALPGSSFAITW